MTATKSRVWNVHDAEALTYGVPLDALGNEQPQVFEIDEGACVARRHKVDEQGELVIEADQRGIVVEVVDAHGWTMRRKDGAVIAVLPAHETFPARGTQGG